MNINMFVPIVPAMAKWNRIIPGAWFQIKDVDEVLSTTLDDVDIDGLIAEGLRYIGTPNGKENIEIIKKIYNIIKSKNRRENDFWRNSIVAGNIQKEERGNSILNIACFCMVYFPREEVIVTAVVKGKLKVKTSKAQDITKPASAILRNYIVNTWYDNSVILPSIVKSIDKLRREIK